MGDGEFEDLTRRRVSDKILQNKAFNIANNPKYDEYYRGLASIVYKFFDKKSASLARSETLATRDKCTSGSGIKNENMSDKELAKKLHKLSIRKFKKGKVYSSFIDNIWGADLVGMQLISKFNKGIRFLCAIDIFSKYARVIPLKDKKSIAIPNAFQKILDESNRKQNIIWVDKGSEFYNRSMKSWLEKNSIEMYSIHNEGKSVVAERFIRTLKNKIYNYMTLKELRNCISRIICVQSLFCSTRIYTSLHFLLILFEKLVFFCLSVLFCIFYLSCRI